MQKKSSKSKRPAPRDPDEKEKVLARLRSVEGHLRGVTQMVAEGSYCIDILQQTKAIHGALSRIETLLLERHLHHCVTTAVRSKRPQDRERVIRELLDVFGAGSSRER